MTRKQRQAKKASKSSKRTGVVVQHEEDSDTATTSTTTKAPQAMPATSQPEGALESQHPVTATVPTAETTSVPPSNPVTRSDAAKANIKEGLRLHQIAGRPTRQQLSLVFGVKGYLLTWPKRTEKFGITPETFQTALAKGVPAVRLTPVAKPRVEKTKETT